MKTQRILLSLFTVFIPSISDAKTATFSWQNELCEYKGVYDTNKFTVNQLNDTIKMMQSRHSTQLNSKSYAFHPDDIAKINLIAIQEEYKVQKEALNNLHPLPIKEFQQLKKELIQNLDQEYQHSYLTALAFTQPTKLLTSTFAPQCLNQAKALNAQDKLSLINNAKLSLQRENQLELKLGNDPQFLMKRSQDFDIKLKSKNAVQYAQIQLIREWSNCANPHETTNDQLEQIFRKKVFIQSKEVYCDEP